MSGRHGKWALSICFAFAVAISCGDERPESPETGTVVVRVIDPSLGPVPDVEVSLAGTNLVGMTDREGTIVFQVARGGYFVDAAVCCVGPGLIEHHEAVRVVGGKTVEVELRACLVCL